jgi:hypothetical protein
MLFGGVTRVSNLAKVLSIAVLWLVMAAGSASAANPPLPVNPLPPFVKVFVPEEPLNLGKLWASGSNQVSGKTNLHVVANCPYRIEASLKNLRHGGGKGSISPKHVWVVINGERTLLGGRVPVAQSWRPTVPTGLDVPVELTVAVNEMTVYPAGRYNGTLVITVMAAP